MKNFIQLFFKPLALLATAVSLQALAAGNHAGGHGHGHNIQTIGEAGKSSKVTRTIEVEMLDTMRFVPSTFNAKQGETIRFVVKNSGQLKHEFVLGTKNDLDETLRSHEKVSRNGACRRQHAQRSARPNRRNGLEVQQVRRSACRVPASWPL